MAASADSAPSADGTIEVPHATRPHRKMVVCTLRRTFMPALPESQATTHLSQIRPRYARRAALSFLGLFVVSAGLGGCATAAQQIDAQAAASGFERSVVAGLDYRHVVYRTARRGGPELHVYIDNDGVPWTGRYRVAADPTGTGFGVLALMTADPAPALYLGRPCYLGLAGEPPCTPLAWTHERYSRRAVDSMDAALRRLLAARPPTRLVFIGHSGGGTMAVLLAPRFAQTVAVITLAANLDLRAWERAHGYTPLRGSLDPNDAPPLASHILQRHYVGDGDGNVTADMLRHHAQTHPGAQVQVISGLDHACCWAGVWPSILEDVQAELRRLRVP
ncbi:MAG: hypothetical protein ABIX46_02440 [Burkholderiaceae bacterium]